MAASPRRQSARTPAQNRQMWSLLGQLAKVTGVDADELRDAHCQAVSGQTHSSRLTERQAEQMIGRLQQALNDTRRVVPPEMPAAQPHEPFGPRNEGGRLQETKPLQNAVIHGLFNLCRDLGIGFGDFGSRRAFVQRQCRVDWPQTEKQADQVIEPLSAMALRKVDVADIRRRVFAMRGNRRLDRWKTGFVADVCRQFDEADNPRVVLSPFKLVKILECEAALAEDA